MAETLEKQPTPLPLLDYVKPELLDMTSIVSILKGVHKSGEDIDDMEKDDESPSSDIQLDLM